MKMLTEVTILFVLFCGIVYAFGGKTQMDRSNGSKIAAAGMIALAILAALGS